MRDDGVGAALGVVHQLVDVLLRQRDRQDAVLEAVVVEDVGEARRDHAADAEVEQRPGRVLARRAAAEVLAGDEDLSPCGRPGLFSTKSATSLPSCVVAHLVEQVLAEPGALDGLQELLGDDHVGVDVDQRQRRRHPGQLGELVHGDGPSANSTPKPCPKYRSSVRGQPLRQRFRRLLAVRRHASHVAPTPLKRRTAQHGELVVEEEPGRFRRVPLEIRIALREDLDCPPVEPSGTARPGRRPSNHPGTPGRTGSRRCRR